VSTPIQNLAAALADRTDRELLDFLHFLAGGRHPNERLLEFAIVEAVEKRHPELAQILDQWSADCDWDKTDWDKTTVDVVIGFLQDKEARS
jgi:hypothetical protein